MSDWKEVLAPTPECIDLARLDVLTEQDHRHLEECVGCQTEAALFREVMAEETSPASQWVAQRLGTAGRRPADRPASGRRSMYALAAALAIAIGIGTWMQMREPAIDTTSTGTYRSVRLEGLTPYGDLTQAPNELRWTPVPQATRYHVQIVEIDATPVWSADTTEPRSALPQTVVAQFRPGKTLRWEVQAFRGNESLAMSETQTVRVTPP